ncbi:hypothetical protein NDU88_001638 [Pleurodeles waltl]|uniref:Uncharacterized protein n=1 Tax=Pleurodeles waltl TaxID=8319 RepID=A0AAV7P4K8_PLEWA|nr:hypothetical protein NDU88_001638 [Pleurodeles waltl]
MANHLKVELQMKDGDFLIETAPPDKVSKKDNVMGKRVKAMNRGILSVPVWSYFEPICTVRVAAVCTLVRVAAWHSAFSFRFSGLQGSTFLYQASTAQHAWVLLSPWWAELAALLSCWTSDLTPGPLLSILAGPEQLPPAVGMPDSQSHRAWAHTATLVPGHGVGR